MAVAREAALPPMGRRSFTSTESFAGCSPPPIAAARVIAEKAPGSLTGGPDHRQAKFNLSRTLKGMEGWGLVAWNAAGGRITPK
jgi:predicted transcriptional regulator